MALAIMDRVPVYDKSVKRLYICIASRMLSKFLHSMIFRMAETMCQRIIWTGGRRPHACTRIAFVVVTVTQRVPYIMAKYRYCYGDFICDYRRIAFSFGRDLVYRSCLSKHTPSCFEVSPGKSNFPNQICLTSQLRRDREKYSRLNMPR